MELIYNNKKTGTFIEFTVEDIDENLSDSDIIDAFMEKVKTFDDTEGILLPETLLALLEDKELDLFLLAAYNEQYCNEIEQMLFVVKYDEHIKDQHGVEYRVEYAGKYKTVLSFETIRDLAVFNIPTKGIIEGAFDSVECNKELF